MPATTEYPFPADCAATVFLRGEASLALTRLCGLTAGQAGRDQGPPSARGLGVLDTDQGCFEADSLPLLGADFSADGLTCTWQAGDLRLDSRWELCPTTGVWRRADSLTNLGPAPVTIFRCLARFVLSRGATRSTARAVAGARRTRAAGATWTTAPWS